MEKTITYAADNTHIEDLIYNVMLSYIQNKNKSRRLKWNLIRNLITDLRFRKLRSGLFGQCL
jgi:hypothetical protein